MKTARDMFAAAEDAFEDADIAIFAAAVGTCVRARRAGHVKKKGIADAELGNHRPRREPGHPGYAGRAQGAAGGGGFARRDERRGGERREEARIQARRSGGR